MSDAINPLEHLDRLATCGEVWEPPPARRRRHPVLFALAMLLLAAGVLSAIYGLLLAGGVE